MYPKLIVLLTLICFSLLLAACPQLALQGSGTDTPTPNQNTKNVTPLSSTLTASTGSPETNTPIPTATLTLPAFVTNIWVASGKSYMLEACSKGSLYYIDDTYKITNFSDPFYDGLSCIKTSNDGNDRNSDIANLIKFTLKKPATIFIYFDRRMERPPGWTRGLFSKRENAQIFVDDADMDYFQVYACDSQAGEIVLGGPKQGNTVGGKSMYVVAFKEIEHGNKLCSTLAPPIATNNTQLTATNTSISTVTIPSVAQTSVTTDISPPDLHILQSGVGNDQDVYIIAGKDVKNYKVGDKLVAYTTLATGVEIPIALLRIFGENPTTLLAQTILFDRSYPIQPNLRLDAQVDQVNTAALEPMPFIPAEGYLINEGSIYILNGVTLTVGTTMQALTLIEAGKNGKIIDAIPSSPTTTLRVTNIGRAHKAASVVLVEGEWPPTGTLLSLVGSSEPTPTPIPKITVTPTLQSVPLSPPIATPDPSKWGSQPPSPSTIGSVWDDDIYSTNFVFVPGGEFMMGSTDEQAITAFDVCLTFYKECKRELFDKEMPQHKVNLDSFWIMKTEVTNLQYKKCVEAGKCTKPHNDGWDKLEISQYPVTDVDWNQARVYADWVGGRLPTEAEWEKAARGIDGRIYPWGNEWDASRANYCDKNCTEEDRDIAGDDQYAALAPVGIYLKGASPYGAFDMAGNVGEWVFDYYDTAYYKHTPYNNPIGPAIGHDRVLRGGTFNHYRGQMRTTYRDGFSPDKWYGDVGFRVVRGMPQSVTPTPRTPAKVKPTIKVDGAGAVLDIDLIPPLIIDQK